MAERAAPLLLRLYGAASWLAAAAAPLLLATRERRGKEDAGRRGERLGQADRPRPDGELVWIHAASVGETAAVLPLIEALAGARPKTRVLLTTGTVTSAELAAARTDAPVIHQFVPLDTPPFARRFLDHWRPDLAVFVESELWPNLLRALDRRGIPRVLVNARLSERSARRWQRAPRLAGYLLSGFAAVLAQTEEDAARLSALGARDVEVGGNLKSDAEPLPADAAALAALHSALGSRKTWVAASTHPGEERIVAAAHGRLRKQYGDVLTVIVPRHRERGAAIAEELAAAGYRVARRAAAKTLPDEDTEIYVADTLGELGLFYRVAQVVFMGGSLVPHGGQNPLEPARLGSAVLHGPHVHNFAAVYADFDAAGAAREVGDAAALAKAAGALLASQKRTATMAEKGAGVLAGLSGARDLALQRLEAILNETGARRSAVGAKPGKRGAKG